MIRNKVRNRRVEARMAECVHSSADSEGIPRTIAVDVGRIISSACRNFARAVDWQNGFHIVSQHGYDGLKELGTGYKVSENHEGLRSGKYISVRVLQSANALAIEGGYYDRYWQPKAVCKESVPLREVTAKALGCLLMEMHDRLDICSRTKDA